MRGGPAYRPLNAGGTIHDVDGSAVERAVRAARIGPIRWAEAAVAGGYVLTSRAMQQSELEVLVKFYWDKIHEIPPNNISIQLAGQCREIVQDVVEGSYGDVNAVVEGDLATPLSLLIDSGVSDAIVMPFVQCGADPRQDVHRDYSSFASAIYLDYVINEGERRCTEFISHCLQLADGAVLNGWVEDTRRTSLHIATEISELTLIEALVGAGADVDATECVEAYAVSPPLADAVEAKDVATVRLLLASGASWTFQAGMASSGRDKLGQLGAEERQRFIEQINAHTASE